MTNECHIYSSNHPLCPRYLTVMKSFGLIPFSKKKQMWNAIKLYQTHCRHEEIMITTDMCQWIEQKWKISAFFCISTYYYTASKITDTHDFVGVTFLMVEWFKDWLRPGLKQVTAESILTISPLKYCNCSILNYKIYVADQFWNNCLRDYRNNFHTSILIFIVSTTKLWQYLLESVTVEA